MWKFFNFDIVLVMTWFANFWGYYKQSLLAPIYFHTAEDSPIREAAEVVSDFTDTFAFFVLCIVFVGGMVYHRNSNLSIYGNGTPSVNSPSSSSNNHIKKLFSLAPFYKTWTKVVTYFKLNK